MTAVLVLDVPSRIAALGSGNLDRLVAPTTTESFGRQVDLAGRAARPPLQVSAEEPTPVRVVTRGLRAGKGHRFMALELTIHNAGRQPWLSTEGTEIQVADRVGTVYRADARVLKVRGAKVLAGVTRLLPGHTHSAGGCFRRPPADEHLFGSVHRWIGTDEDRRVAFGAVGTVDGVCAD